jgi:hypothetical protein
MTNPVPKPLFYIKLIHSAVWLFFVSVIFYIVYAGLADRVTRWTWIAIASVVAEGLILMAFRGFCPLTVLGRRYSDSTAANFDIFLPEWLAYHNKRIFTAVYLIGVGLVVWRTWG